jgi:opacity protein-like surface antigen
MHMRKELQLIILLSIFIAPLARCQEDMMNMFGPDSSKKNEFTTATFKTTHLVIGQSIETVAKGNMNFTISHHFGKINEGYYTLWGLDQSTIRLGLEYGINNRISVGVGRSSYQKTYDGNVKIKIVRQKKSGIPLTVTYFGEMTINSLHWEDPARVNYFTSRMAYVNQLLIASKITSGLSVQLMPTHVHKNLVKLIADQNDIFAVGAGMRYKFSKRMSVNSEYYYLLPGKTADDFYNSLSVGVDIETGGHVFQLFFTNSHPLFERGFITETEGSWGKGDIYFGFNITRTFTLKK